MCVLTNENTHHKRRAHPLDKSKLLCAASILLGALSFLMLLPGFVWWVGLACALAAVILGRRRMRQPARLDQICGIIATVLALLGTGVFMVFSLFH